MFPVICQIGHFSVYSYGLMLALGFLAAAWLASKRSAKEGLAPELIFNLSFFSLLCGIIGARLFYIAENLSYYTKNPLEVLMFQKGGLSWFGGLILGSIFAVGYLKKNKVPVMKTLDLLAPFIALAQAIGRLGCFLNGCCFGRPSESGIYFPVHAERLVPTQVYSSLMLLFIFIVARGLLDKPHKRGEVFFVYLLLDSLGRFIIEFWRADNQVVFRGLTLFHFISLGIFALSLVALFYIRRREA